MNLSSHNPFDERRKSLEDAFFKARDQQLLEKMRRELSSFEESRKLAHVSGIAEELVLTHLVQAGVQAETMAAVALTPLVEVAWCDGAVAPEERDAVLNAAVAQGVHMGSASYELLEHWLQVQPDPLIFTAWKEYVRELVRIMPKESVAPLKKNLLQRAERVAAAAGGFLGLSTISKHERVKLDEVARAMEG